MADKNGKEPPIQQQEVSETNTENELEEEEREPSVFYKIFSTIFYIILLCSLGITIVLTLFTLDFMDIYTFRHKIPESFRKGWPLEPYYEFVKLHQLPEEERYQQLIYQEQNKFNQMMSEGNQDLEKRSQNLENSYKALVRTQKEQYKLDQEKIRKREEELNLKEKQLNDGLADLEKRKAAIDDLSNRLASEALNIESSLIRFMEKENRLDQICSIAAQMEPKSLAKVFEEVPDDQLIYDIMGGLQPTHCAKVLSNMDTEKAAKIMRVSNNPLTLPPPNQGREYIPQSLTNLINETQANQR